MEKSLYFEYVQQFFPQLVTSIVEKLNGKRAQALPYLFRDHLTKRFSPDGRWASITAEYNRVAADVVSLDSELPLKSRDTVSLAQGEIPKLGMKLYMSEKQMKDLSSMIAQQMPVGQILLTMFSDLPRVIEGVYERIEDMFLAELSTGVAVSTRSGGQGVRINVGFDENNQFAVKAVWTDNKNSTPLDDIQKIYDKALLDQNAITDVYADDVALNNLYKSEQVRYQYAFNQGFAGQNVPVLNLDQLSAVFMSKWQTRLHRVARTIKTELNGVKKTHSPWEKGHLTFTCFDNLGDLVWTNVMEAQRPVTGVTYQAADDYILASRYSTNDPLREFTCSQAMVVPILNNVDTIYSLDSTKVAG